jgi:REP element-mobilizing transposase RayT
MRLLRKIEPNQPVEITCRTVQGRHLMRPSPELNRRIVGVLGRAQRQTGMVVHAVVVMSNHIHYLLSPASAEQLARFLQYAQGNIAREVSRFCGWKGPFWARRYQHIQISNEDEAQMARLRYVLAHGVKEDLVACVGDWPGVHSALTLAHGETLAGIWYDWTALGEQKRRGRPVCEEDFGQVETLVLSPLPCWSGLPAEEVRCEVQALVKEIDQTARERRQADGIRVAGRGRVLRSSRRKPREMKRKPAPRFHTATRDAWFALRDAYVEFVAQFRDAADLLRQGVRDPPFPPGSFPPGLPFVPHEATG